MNLKDHVPYYPAHLLVQLSGKNQQYSESFRTIRASLLISACHQLVGGTTNDTTYEGPTARTLVLRVAALSIPLLGKP